MLDRIDVYPYHRVPARNRFKSVSPSKKRERSVAPIRDNLKRFLIELLPFQLTAFLLARAVVLGEILPFGTAFFAAVLAEMRSKQRGVALAVVLGTLSVAQGQLLIGQTILLALLSLLCHAIPLKYEQRWIVMPTLVFAGTVLCHGGLVLFLEPNLYNALVVFFQALFSSVLTFVFLVDLGVIKEAKRLDKVSWEENLCLAVLVLGIVTGMSDLTLGYIAFQNVLSSLAILLAAGIGGTGGGASVGVLLGIIPSITAMASPAVVAFYALSGLLAGFFKNLGKAGIILGFLLGNMILSLYFIDKGSIIIYLSSSAAAGLVYLLIPRQLVDNLIGIGVGDIKRAGRQEEEKHLQEITTHKIKEIALVFHELSRTFAQIAGDQQQDEDRSLSYVFNQVAGKVCQSCVIHKVCWENDFYKTYKNIVEVLSQLEIKGSITTEDVPSELSRRCMRLNEMVIAFTNLFETQKINHYWQRKIKESREIVSSQLRGAAEIMTNLAHEIRFDNFLAENLERHLLEELNKQGFYPDRLSLIRQSGRTYDIEIHQKSCTGKLECLEEVLPVASQILGIPLRMQSPKCGARNGKSRCSYRLYSTPAYSISVGVAGKAKEGSYISGDNYTSVMLKNGQHALILSDGMGAGAQAALESNTTISLLEQLLETGFDKDLAVQTANSILMLRSSKESFATVDLVLFDLYTGNASFVKIGAASSFIKRGNNIQVIKSSSLPIGIVDDIEVESMEYHLQTGDLLIMITDGIIDGQRELLYQEAWLVDLINSIPSIDPQIMAETILETAVAINGGVANDDMTVLVARVDSEPV